MPRLPRLAVAAALLAVAAAAGAEDDPAERYREAAGRILGRALVDEGAFVKLEHLTTRIGHRLSGSPGLEKAVAWALEGMKAEGLEGVRLQAVRVPRWVRGRERARVVSPVERELPILGLGLSVGTPEGGLTAPVVVVRGFEELEGLGRGKVEGRIVAFAPDWEGYGRTVRFRSSGASAAARLGALAVLVRSATGRSLASPHTGALGYAEDAPKIPAAAISAEDAERMQRIVDRGRKVRVRLRMDAHLEPDVESANVLGEIRGREL
ncbi:MAG TPA: peptidase M28 family protein, partial [Vicinamibacteria bacterium]|nr:peptidase M28 family protein [Vicinamibacteria bacterium]